MYAENEFLEVPLKLLDFIVGFEDWKYAAWTGGHKQIELPLKTTNKSFAKKTQFYKFAVQSGQGATTK